MIISEINGGLGNQMFQFACGKAMALRYNSIFKLSLQKLNTDEFSTARPFELNIFKTNVAISNAQELNRFSPKSLLSKVFFKWLKNYRCYTEKSFAFDTALFKQKGNLFLKGYWQTEKYFETYKSIIRNDFIFTAQKNKRTIQHEKIIEECNAVSVHVRRGDYVSSPIANSFHGVTNLDYYEMAMQKIEEFVDKPFYFLFSDDAQWVKEHLIKDKKNIIVIEHNNGMDSWQDMYLMSKCKHNIIANSSFSWWGAWLNKNVNKIVIAPKQWFANKEKNEQTQDLIPLEWIRL
jgi:hypothetical protein